ncbi:MAG: hypothetical protein ABIH89_03835 [Elusimicrobiota bacterium]
MAASGLGETFTAFGEDISVVYYNPALLHRFTASYVSASHTFLFDTARYDFLGFSYALDRSAFAITGTQLYRDNIEVRQHIDDEPSDTYCSRLLLTGAYSIYIKRLKLSSGCSINYMKYDMYDLNDYGIGLDIGLAKKLFSFGNPLAKGLHIDTGINFKNIVQKPVRIVSEKEKLPLIIKGGISAKLTLFPRYNKVKNILSYDELLFATDINCRESKVFLSYGVYYKLLNIVILRAGYNDNVSFGAGLSAGDLVFDYAYSLKSFTSFHNIGFSYKFNEKEVEPVSVTFTDEFQKVYKKALRIYDRYIRNAKELAERNNYNQAVELLKKAIPLKPNDNKHAKDLLEVYENTISANKSNEYLSKANQYRGNDNLLAYKNYLKAYDTNPNDRNTVSFINNLYNSLSGDEKNNVDNIRSDYIDKLAEYINAEIDANDFLKAVTLFQKLNLFAPESSITINLNSILKDNKELYLYKMVSLGMENINKKNYVEAYKLFYKAHELKPEDTSFNDQMEISKKKYLKIKEFSLQDEMYADKLYYLTAINYATGENPVPLYNELVTFNELHENLPALEAVRKTKAKIQP